MGLEEAIIFEYTSHFLPPLCLMIKSRTWVLGWGDQGVNVASGIVFRALRCSL